MHFAFFEVGLFLKVTFLEGTFFRSDLFGSDFCVIALIGILPFWQWPFLQGCFFWVVPFLEVAFCVNGLFSNDIFKKIFTGSTLTFFTIGNVGSRIVADTSEKIDTLASIQNLFDPTEWQELGYHGFPYGVLVKPRISERMSCEEKILHISPKIKKRRF